MTDGFRKRMKGLARDTRGATAVEYGFILSLVVLAAMGAMGFMADRTTAMWDHVAAEVINAG